MKRVLYGLAALLALCSAAVAQVNYPSEQKNARVPAQMADCLNRMGIAVPCAFSDTAADVLHRYQSARPEHRAVVVSQTPNDACTPSSTPALASNRVVAIAQSAPLTLCGFNVSADSTLSGAAWWIMIFDAVTLPGDGASQTPVKCYAMASGTTSYSAGFTGSGEKFKTGIVIGVSTNGCFTLAASVHAFISGAYR